MATKPANKAACPAKEIRFGRIRAAIWKNETQNGTRYNVTVSRLYKDGDEWKDSNSFGRDDLPVVSKVLDHCHTWIFRESGGSETGNGVDADVDSSF